MFAAAGPMLISNYSICIMAEDCKSRPFVFVKLYRKRLIYALLLMINLISYKKRSAQIQLYPEHKAV